MLQNTLKRLGLIILLLISFATVKAQSGDTFSSFSIGLGVGTTTVYDYTLEPQNKTAFHGTLSYNITPFFTLTGETQIGRFEGGDLTAFNMKHFQNTYIAAILHADLQLGELIDYSRSDFLYGLKDLYGGTGVGVLQNTIFFVQPFFPESNNQSFYNITLSSSNIIIPTIVGYDFKIYNGYSQPQIRVDVSYTWNTVFGQGIDGYVTEAPFKFYSYLSVGIKFGFGNAKLYRKPIRY